MIVVNLYAPVRVARHDFEALDAQSRDRHADSWDREDAATEAVTRVTAFARGPWENLRSADLRAQGDLVVGIADYLVVGTWVLRGWTQHDDGFTTLDLTPAWHAAPLIGTRQDWLINPGGPSLPTRVMPTPTSPRARDSRVGWVRAVTQSVGVRPSVATASAVAQRLTRAQEPATTGPQA